MQDQEQEKMNELWESTGLLSGISDKYKKSSMAVMLENQRLVSEMIIGTDKADPRIIRMAIPFIRRIYGYTDLYDMVSVQPLISPTGMAFIADGYKIVRNYEIPARPVRMTPTFPGAKEEEVDLEEEAKIASELSLEYSQHITRHVIQDLRNAAGIQLDHVYRRLLPPV